LWILKNRSLTSANGVFCGQLGAMYLFREDFNPAQIVAIYQLGPGCKVGVTICYEFHVNFELLLWCNMMFSEKSSIWFKSLLYFWNSVIVMFLFCLKGVFLFLAVFFFLHELFHSSDCFLMLKTFLFCIHSQKINAGS
jgi:hypothetical protein